MSLTKLYSAEAVYADDEEEIDVNDNNYHSMEDESESADDVDQEPADSMMSTNTKEHIHPPYGK